MEVWPLKPVWGNCRWSNSPTMAATVNPSNFYSHFYRIIIKIWLCERWKYSHCESSLRRRHVTIAACLLMPQLWKFHQIFWMDCLVFWRQSFTRVLQMTTFYFASHRFNFILLLIIAVWSVFTKCLIGLHTSPGASCMWWLKQHNPSHTFCGWLRYN